MYSCLRPLLVGKRALAAHDADEQSKCLVDENLRARIVGAHRDGRAGRGRSRTMLPTNTSTQHGRGGLSGVSTTGNDLFGRPTRRRSRIEWWYQLTAPSEPSVGTSIEIRERLRRGRLASTLMLGLWVISIFALPVAFSDPPTLI